MAELDSMCVLCLARTEGGCCLGVDEGDRCLSEGPVYYRPLTTVVNIHHSPYDVLIDRTTIFGNPFPESKWGRDRCIQKFSAYFWDRIERDPAWKAEVPKLKGKVLGCHCKPLACHGDVYVDFLETYEQVEQCRVLPPLKALVSKLNSLAVDHGWYEPELQGEAAYELSRMDSPIFRRLVETFNENPSFDLLKVIARIVREQG